MARNEIPWHENFIAYMEEIINHPNYKGMPMKKNVELRTAWVVGEGSKDMPIRKARIEWFNNKAKELNMTQDDKNVKRDKHANKYSDVMREIHPTKMKVCQVCGKQMSIYFYYPNANLLKSLNREFDCNYNDCNHISDIWDDLVNNKGVESSDIARFLIQKGKLDLDVKTATKDSVIDTLEKKSRINGGGYLGPGAMSDFPDRLDGFHTFNRCCRGLFDKGRSRKNMQSYEKDRRAYEYWSDGNVNAANQYMNKIHEETGNDADHIGPISLGFVHSSYYLQPMSNSDNSAKRDRLRVEDLNKIVEIESKTNIPPMSWQSKSIWGYIRANYRENTEKVGNEYRNVLKQNMTNYMYILKNILDNCPQKGKDFLIKAYLEPHFDDFNYDYSFNEHGEIIGKEDRHRTESSQEENDRYIRIAFEGVYNYNEKENRNIKPDLTGEEEIMLKMICTNIENGYDMNTEKKEITDLIEKIESRLIENL